MDVLCSVQTPCTLVYIPGAVTKMYVAPGYNFHHDRSYGSEHPETYLADKPWGIIVHTYFADDIERYHAAQIGLHQQRIEQVRASRATALPISVVGTPPAGG